jgi:hypothetical protein
MVPNNFVINKLYTMKTKYISRLAIISLVSLSLGSIQAQTNETQPKKENVINIKVVKNINGVETIIDTTISGDENIWKQTMELPDFTINENLDSIMKTVEIEMRGLHDELKGLDEELKHLEKFHQLNIDLTNLEVLKELEKLHGIKLDIQIDSNFTNDHDALMLQHLNIENMINIRDSNVTVMILSEDDAEYQKIMKELEKDKDGNLKTERRVMIIQEDCKGKKDKGEKMIVEMQVIIKTCNIEDLTNEDRKRLKNEERSFNEKLKVDQVNFYPNPNNGRFNLGFTLEKQGDTEISIMNMEGKQVYNERLPGFSGSYKKEIDISNNASGIYYIKVAQGKDSFFKKMVLQ